MGEKAKSLVQSMKERISNSGSKKGNIFYLKKDGKCRVRFLQDMEEGTKIQFHSKYGEFNHVCLSYFGKKCPNCKNTEAKTYDSFCWTVWNYETKKKELFLFKANKLSPIPALIGMFENYGTICDRDYVIQRNGDGFETSYSVVPMDKKKFKGEEEPISKKKMLKILKEAFPVDEDDSDYDNDDEEDEEEDEEEEEVVAKKKSKKEVKKRVVEDDDDDEDDDDEEEKPKKSKKEDKKKSKKKKKVIEEDEEDEDDDEDELPWEDEDEDDD